MAKSDTSSTSPNKISIRRNYAELYRKAQSTKERIELFNQAKEEENIYRELFAQERTSPELEDKHAMLINTHENEDIFRYVNCWKKKKSLK